MSYTQITSMNATNSNTLVDVFVNVNAASGYVFGGLLMLTIFMGYYFLFSKEQTIKDMIASSFVTCVVSVPLLIIGIITWQVFMIGLCLMLVLIILSAWMS